MSGSARVEPVCRNVPSRRTTIRVGMSVKCSFEMLFESVAPSRLRRIVSNYLLKTQYLAPFRVCADSPYRWLARMSLWMM